MNPLQGEDLGGRLLTPMRQSSRVAQEGAPLRPTSKKRVTLLYGSKRPQPRSRRRCCAKGALVSLLLLAGLVLLIPNLVEG